VAGLAEVAVDSGFDLDARPRIEAVGDQGSDGAEGFEAFAAHPLRFFALQIAGGEIIYAGVAEDVGAYVIARGEPVAAAGDHDSQFALVIGVRGSLGPKNRSARRRLGRPSTSPSLSSGAWRSRRVISSALLLPATDSTRP